MLAARRIFLLLFKNSFFFFIVREIDLIVFFSLCIVNFEKENASAISRKTEAIWNYDSQIFYFILFYYFIFSFFFN